MVETKKKTVKNRINDIVRLRRQGELFKDIAKVLDVSVASIKSAYGRYMTKEGLKPEVKDISSTLIGHLGVRLEQIVREKPWLSYKELSDSLKPFCVPGINPPKREAVRKFLLKKGICRDELRKKVANTKKDIKKGPKK